MLCTDMMIGDGGLDATPLLRSPTGFGGETHAGAPRTWVGVRDDDYSYRFVSFRIVMSPFRDMACRTVQVLYRATVIQINETGCNPIDTEVQNVSSFDPYRLVVASDAEARCQR